MHAINVNPADVVPGDTLQIVPGYGDNDFDFLAGTAQPVLISGVEVKGNLVHLTGEDYTAFVPKDHTLTKIVF